MFRIRTTLPILALAAAPGLFADIINFGSIDLGGTGLGNVATILTQQPANGQLTTSSGCVELINNVQTIGTGCNIAGVAGGDEQQQTQIRFLGDSQVFGGTIDSAYDIGIVFNGAEPTGQDSTILSVDALNLVLYDGSGNVLFEASLAAGEGDGLLPASGTGNSGYLFALNDAQAALAQTAIGNLDIAGVRIGLSANVTGANGGLETFFLADANRTPPGGGGEIPEPATLSLVGGSFIGIALFRRSRRSR